MRKDKSLSVFELYAYCLMPNHLHLLVREGMESEPIDRIMRRLGTWYVCRFNRAVSEGALCKSTLQQMRKAGASLNQIVRLIGTIIAIVRKAVE